MGFFTLLLFLLFSLLSLSQATQDVTWKGIDLDYPSLDVSPPHSADGLLCDRVSVSGISRLKLASYSSSFRVSVVPSVVVPERLHGKIQICFHRNDSLGLCQCGKDEWKSINKGLWSSVMSPYEDRYVDLFFHNAMAGPVTVALDEDSQQWRLACLAFGFMLLLLAPFVSSWVPFYYSSSMVIGVFLVIIILLFQGMKLLPTGRKSALYFTIYGSMLGAGSFVLHHFSMMVSSILVKFGLDEEMHNPVSIFLLVGIVLAGAALGYWIVRRYVISEDGTVDIGVAQFVKWAMRIIGVTSIFQSSLDFALALGATVCCWAVCSLITSYMRHRAMYQSYSGTGTLWLQQDKNAIGKRNRAEFLSRSSPQGRMWKSPKSYSMHSNSPLNGMIRPSSWPRNERECYSTFHKTPNRKKFTKKEWDDFTRESTRQALAEWASSPEFTDWIVENANRIQLLPSESSEETGGSESDSTEGNAAGSGSHFRLFSW